MLSSSLAAYGAYIRPMPCSNEIGLRMLIGGAVREASLLGYHVTPLFSYYSYHGPVFRVMLQVNRGKEHENRCVCVCACVFSSPCLIVFFGLWFYEFDCVCWCWLTIYDRHYGFISYCNQCGNTRSFSWEELGQISCSCSSNKVYFTLKTYIVFHDNMILNLCLSYFLLVPLFSCKSLVLWMAAQNLKHC